MGIKGIQNVLAEEEIRHNLLSPGILEPEIKFTIESSIFLTGYGGLDLKDLPRDFYHDYMKLEALYAKCIEPSRDSVEKIQVLRDFAQEYAQSQR